MICTGRSSVTGSERSDYDRPETIEETAELVTELGGTGIAAVVDHLDHDEVRSLAERIRRDHEHVDILVNDIWGAEKLTAWETPVWDHDLEDGLRILRLGIETHLVTSHHLLPLMVDRPGGLLVEVGDGTADYNATRYRNTVFYDLVKVAVARLAFSQGHELGARGCTAVHLTPGFLRSEMMLDLFEVTEESWRNAVSPQPGSNATVDPTFAVSESPRYVGRAVAALSADPDRSRWNQRSVTSVRLAHEYGFTDLDGSQPDIWRYFAEVYEPGVEGNPDNYR